MRRPDFIGIGAQKAATSWLAACIAEHPRVWMPRKELGFFSTRYDYNQMQKYWKNFAACPNGHKTGEFSTNYLTTYESCCRIKTWCPDARLIIVVRDPLERAISHWRHCKMRNKIIDWSLIYQKSRLRYYVPKWEREFGEQVLVIDYERLKNYPLNVVTDTYKHIGLTHTHVPSMVFTKINVSFKPKSIRVTRTIDKLGHLRSKTPFKWFWWRPWAIDLRDKIKSFNDIGKNDCSGVVNRLRNGLIEDIEWYKERFPKTIY